MVRVRLGLGLGLGLGSGFGFARHGAGHLAPIEQADDDRERAAPKHQTRGERQPGRLELGARVRVRVRVRVLGIR